MAFRTWSRLLLTALGVSLLAGAGQLGLAYGFGILRLTGSFTGVTVNQWPAQLVWVGWCAANAAVIGAVLTERVARRDGALTGTGRQLAVAAAAALGATVVAPLCMQPARAAELISVDPVWAVGICAVLGAVVGAGAALAVLLKPPVGWNMAAVAGTLWLLALLSAVPSFSATGALPLVRLGVFEPAWLDADAAQRLAMLVLPTIALLAGAATGALARWRGHPPLVAGATGVAGPVLVAFGYLAAGPGDAVDRYQLAPYYGALLAVAAGALGSAAAALARRPSGAAAPAPRAIEPTDILRPLPAGPALPGAAEAGPERADRAGGPAGVRVAGADLAARPEAGAVGTAPGTEPAGQATPPHWDWPATGTTGATGVPPRTADRGADAATDPAADRATGVDAVAAPAPAPRPAHPAEPVTAVTAVTGDLPGDPAPASAAHAGGMATRAPGDPASGTPAGGQSEPVAADDAAEQPGGAGRTRKGRSSRATAAPAAGRSTRRATAAEEPATAASTDADAVAATPAEPAPRPRRTRKAKATAKRADATTPTADPAAAGAPSAGTPAPGGAATSPASSGTSAGPASGDASTGPAPDGAPAGGGASVSPVFSGASTGPAPDSAPTSPAGGGASTGPAASGRASVSPAASGRVPTSPAAPGGASTGSAPAAPLGATADPATTGGADATGTPITGIEAAATAVPSGPTTEPTPAGADPATGPTPPTGDGAPAAGKRREGTREPARPVLKPVPAPATPTADRPAAPRSSWPVAPAWSAPPRPTSAERDEATAVPEDTTGHRPRHRAPLPDLDRAASWEALATARRAGPTAPTDATSEGPAGGEDTTPDGAAAGAGEQNGGRLRGRLGLFRRNRARTTDESGAGETEAEPLAAQDEEYVDWVAGLGRPLADNEPEQESGRRSLRSSGRHHRD
ncbi:hypothetical protein Q3W71_12835 [Micromonospora sp. C28SCA-DRY-2]|uniref:hypothetical protein n=1 Tax=Micromonospora sp. C28SCA-DRY-2 TaxID=3059522 RepID=UPI002677423E|nr:hypothetical protein [Micromonospora sp. C28SCA-DRY-2]MDO3702558.1 hypothetical protein [Micromonospora sp. C28SCA-DRY-2]